MLRVSLSIDLDGPTVADEAVRCESRGGIERRTAQGPMPVQYVTDGDTIGVQTPRGTIRVRLIGVDTPETKKPGTPVQCWGPQASAATRTLLSGESVWLERDTVAGQKDKYGRDLVYVRLGDRLINQELITAGAGRQHAYRDQKYRYRSTFEDAEHTAKERKTGLWNACP